MILRLRMMRVTIAEMMMMTKTTTDAEMSADDLLSEFNVV